MIERTAHVRITERSIGDLTVLDLHGPLFGPEATERFGATVHRLARQRLVVNLEDVPSMDAAGLGALVDAYRVMTCNGGTFRLAHVTKRLHDLIVITRLVTVFDIFDSVGDAIRDGSGVTGDRPPCDMRGPFPPTVGASVVAGVAGLDPALPAPCIASPN